MKKTEEISPPEDELRVAETPAIADETLLVDEFVGQGGAYVFDGLTKKRVSNNEE